MVEPVTGGPLAFLGTVVSAWLFLSFTAQISASFFRGEAPWRRAAVVGVVPTVVTAAMISFDPWAILLVALPSDLVAFRVVYHTRTRSAALLTGMHTVATVALAVVLAQLVLLFVSAPG